FAFCLACEEYPKELAAALGGLPGFDFAAITAQGERSLRILHAVADEAQAVRYICDSAQDDVDRIDSRLSELEMRVEKAAGAMTTLAEKFRLLVRVAQE